MNFEILLSCMHQDVSIIKKSNIKANAIIINQCDCEKKEYLKIENNNVCCFVSTKERGLSKSRNMAVRESRSDICLIADDDEKFCDDLEDKVISSFRDNPNFDVITFNVTNGNKKLIDYNGKIGYIKALMTSSWQIAFKRKSILEKNISFCEKMGSGTGNGGGEENKFLYDCLNSGLKIKHLPITIASMSPLRKSLWMNGFSEKFFINRGWATKQYLGRLGAVLYALEYCIAKHNKYKNNISFFKAFKCCLQGIKENR